MSDLNLKRGLDKHALLSKYKSATKW